MRPLLKFETDSISKRCSELMKNVMEDAAPGCIEWWEKQPIDFIQQTLNDLDRSLQSGNLRAIDIAFAYAERELKMYVRFHKGALKWVEAVIRVPAKEKISPRLVPDHLLEAARKAGVLDDKKGG